MGNRKNISWVVRLLVPLIMMLSAALVSAEGYRPPIAKLDGQVSASFPDDVSLNFKRFGTIEFWVAAKWDSLDYDPAIVSYLGNLGPRFAILMPADKKGIAMMADQKWEVAPFDFSDGKLHHVAFIVIDSRTSVFVDDELVAILPIGIADLPAHSLSIGSFNGRDAGFVGVLAGLRIWDSAVDPDDIAAYKLVDLASQKGAEHPSLDTLVGTSDFAHGKVDFSLVDEPLSLYGPRELDDSDLPAPAALGSQ